MKTRTLILIGAAVFLVSLLLNTPGALLYSKLVKAPEGVGAQLTGIDGTISEGGASSVLLNGQPLVTGLHWHFRPWALLLARAAFNIDSSGSLTLEGKVAKLITGGLNLDDLRATGPLKTLLVITGDAYAPFDGQIGLKLDSARIRNGFVTAIEGELTINSLRSTLGAQPTVFGDLIARITTTKDVITAKLEPLSGPLDLSGEVRVMSNRDYEIDVQVRAKPDAPETVRNQIKLIGQPDAQGYYRIRSSGNMGGATPAAQVPAPAIPQ